ncbi:hypothetical protein B0H11DRAFT_484012 [Mycena galericulata]|nr:hypothetical protein B0H11DRAFT_484012 [Mycena galericulata]
MGWVGMRLGATCTYTGVGGAFGAQCVLQRTPSRFVCVPASTPLEFKHSHFAFVSREYRPKAGKRCGTKVWAVEEGGRRAGASAVSEEQRVREARTEREGVCCAKDGTCCSARHPLRSPSRSRTSSSLVLLAAHNGLSFPLDVRMQCNSDATRAKTGFERVMHCW